MKHIKFLLINIVAFSFLFFLMSLLFPSQVVTSKTVSVAATKETVIEKLNNTADWKNWNTFSNGEMVNKNTINNSDTMSFSLVNSNQQMTSNFIIYKEETNTVLINWAIVKKLPWYKPWKKFSAMVLGKQVAAEMDTSLNNLKVQIETAK